MHEITSIARSQSPNSTSLRTTLPKEVVNVLKINEGDILIWDLFAEDSNIVCRVSKK